MRIRDEEITGVELGAGNPMAIGTGAPHLIRFTARLDGIETVEPAFDQSAAQITGLCHRSIG